MTFLADLTKHSRAVYSVLEALLDEEDRRGKEDLGLVKKAPAKKAKAAKKKALAQMDQKRFEKDKDKAKQRVQKWWFKVERPRVPLIVVKSALWIVLK